jgi:hypothetical protein
MMTCKLLGGTYFLKIMIEVVAMMSSTYQRTAQMTNHQTIPRIKAHKIMQERGKGSRNETKWKDYHSRG